MIVYWGDGGASATNGNWNTVANWFTSLTPDGVTPGAAYGKVPQPGDSVVLASALGTINITTGPAGGWAGPITWLAGGFMATAGGQKIAAGSYSGTITISAQGVSGSNSPALPDYAGISGGTFSGAVNLVGTAGINNSPVAITGGTFTGTVTRTTGTLAAVRQTYITGGTYSPAASCALGAGNVLSDAALPADPGFAVGGGPFSPVITVTNITASAAGVAPSMNVDVRGAGNIPTGRYSPPFPAP